MQVVVTPSEQAKEVDAKPAASPATGNRQIYEGIERSRRMMAQILEEQAKAEQQKIEGLEKGFDEMCLGSRGAE